MQELAPKELIPEHLKSEYPEEIFQPRDSQGCIINHSYAYDFRRRDSFYYEAGLTRSHMMGLIFLRHLYSITHQRGMSLMITVDGRHRSGKSRMWVTIAALLDRGFLKDMEKRIVTDAEALLKLVNEIDQKKIRNPVIVVDEAGNALHSGDWYEKMQKAIIKTLTVIGYLHPTVIFITTNQDLILSGVRKQAHMYVRVDRYSNSYCLASIYHLKLNPLNRKQYHKKPRMKIDGERCILDHLKFPLPPKWLDERYEILENALKPRLLKEIHDDVMKADVKELKKMFDHEKAADLVVRNYRNFQNQRQRKKDDRGEVNVDPNYIRAKLKCTISDATLVKDMAERRLKRDKNETGKGNDDEGGVDPKD